MENNKKNTSQIIIFLIVFVFLAAGFAMDRTLAGGFSVFDKGGISVKYPDNWGQMQSEDNVFRAVDLLYSGQFSAGITVRKLPMKTMGERLKKLSDMALAWSMICQKDLMLYSPLENQDMKLGEKDAMVLDYAYAVGGAAGSVPTVARARDVLILKDDYIYIFTLAVNNDDYKENEKLFEEITMSIKVR